MSDLVQVSIIGGGFAVVLALIKVVETRLAHTQERMMKKQDDLSGRIDGRMDQLLELTKQLAHAAGMKEQKENDK
jgi:hypothetical protein